jgi:hypothetical protein
MHHMIADRLTTLTERLRLLQATRAMATTTDDALDLALVWTEGDIAWLRQVEDGPSGGVLTATEMVLSALGFNWEYSYDGEILATRTVGDLHERLWEKDGKFIYER